MKNCYFKTIGKMFVMVFFSKEPDLKFEIGLHFKPKLSFSMSADLIWVHLKVSIL